MIKFRKDVELIKCNLCCDKPPKEVTDIRRFLDGVMGPWMVGTVMVDHSDFPGPVYRDKKGNGIKTAVTIYDGDYLVKADGHIFYVPLQLFASLLEETDNAEPTKS